jgi:type II secretory pathway component PulM
MLKYAGFKPGEIIDNRPAVSPEQQAARIAVFRQIREIGLRMPVRWRSVTGRTRSVMVDAETAAIVVTMYRYLNETNREKFTRMEPDEMVAMAYSLSRVVNTGN